MIWNGDLAELEAEQGTDDETEGDVLLALSAIPAHAWTREPYQELLHGKSI